MAYLLARVVYCRCGRMFCRYDRQLVDHQQSVRMVAVCPAAEVTETGEAEAAYLGVSINKQLHVKRITCMTTSSP